jgi:hypothetical protein
MTNQPVEPSQPMEPSEAIEPSQPMEPSEEFLAHWNAVLGTGQDMALTLGLEPLFGDSPTRRHVFGRVTFWSGRCERNNARAISRAARDVSACRAVVDLAGWEHE